MKQFKVTINSKEYDAQTSNDDINKFSVVDIPENEHQFFNDWFEQCCGKIVLKKEVVKDLPYSTDKLTGIIFNAMPGGYTEVDKQTKLMNMTFVAEIASRVVKY